MCGTSTKNAKNSKRRPCILVSTAVFCGELFGALLPTVSGETKASVRTTGEVPTPRAVEKEEALVNSHGEVEENHDHSGAVEGVEEMEDSSSAETPTNEESRALHPVPRAIAKGRKVSEKIKQHLPRPDRRDWATTTGSGKGSSFFDFLREATEQTRTPAGEEDMVIKGGTTSPVYNNEDGGRKQNTPEAEPSTAQLEVRGTRCEGDWIDRWQPCERDGDNRGRQYRTWRIKDVGADHDSCEDAFIEDGGKHRNGHHEVYLCGISWPHFGNFCVADTNHDQPETNHNSGDGSLESCKDACLRDSACSAVEWYDSVKVNGSKCKLMLGSTKSVKGRELGAVAGEVVNGGQCHVKPSTQPFGGISWTAHYNVCADAADTDNWQVNYNIGDESRKICKDACVSHPACSAIEWNDSVNANIGVYAKCKLILSSPPATPATKGKSGPRWYDAECHVKASTQPARAVLGNHQQCADDETGMRITQWRDCIEPDPDDKDKTPVHHPEQQPIPPLSTAPTAQVVKGVDSTTKEKTDTEVDCLSDIC